MPENENENAPNIDGLREAEEPPEPTRNPSDLWEPIYNSATTNMEGMYKQLKEREKEEEKMKKAEAKNSNKECEVCKIKVKGPYSRRLTSGPNAKGVCNKCDDTLFRCNRCASHESHHHMREIKKSISSQVKRKKIDIVLEGKIYCCEKCLPKMRVYDCEICRDENSVYKLPEMTSSPRIGRGGMPLSTRRARGRGREGTKYCSKCDRKLREAIKSYDYRPTAKFKVMKELETEKESKNVFLGVELEVESPKENPEIAALQADKEVNGDSREKLIYIKSDGSLNRGLEIVTHPMTYLFHSEGSFWKPLLAMLKSKGCKSHDTTTCGLHVHVNRTFLTPANVTKLKLFLTVHAKIIKTIARRHGKQYASVKKLHKSSWKKAREGGKYSAVNYSNTRTVEIRFFKGTLNYSTLMASLGFVDSVCRFVKVTSIPILEQPKKGWDAYIAYLKENKYHALLRYLKLKKLIHPVSFLAKKEIWGRENETFNWKNEVSKEDTD